MKRFGVLFGVLLALFSVFSVSDAAALKRPMTMKEFGNQRYYEWSGTAALASGDSIKLYSDTANSYLLDPAGLLMQNKSALPGSSPWWTSPKFGFPEKLCGGVVHRIATGATITFRTFWGDTKSGPYIADFTASSAQSGTAATDVLVHPEMAPKANPGKFFWIAGVVATAADTVSRITIFPCDD